MSACRTRTFSPLKKLAETLLTMAPASVAKAESVGEITKVKCDGKETLKDS